MYIQYKRRVYIYIYIYSIFEKGVFENIVKEVRGEENEKQY